MTAYGRSFFENHVGLCSVEISSVNRRHLEIHLVFPKEFLRFEHTVRKRLADKLSRGHLTVKASFRFNERTPFSIKPNLSFCKQQMDAWKSIANLLGKSEEAIDLSLLQRDHLFIIEEDEEALKMTEELIINALDKAIESLQLMMQIEGKALTEDVQKRLLILKDIVEQVEGASTNASQRLREKLLDRMQEFLPLSEDNEERVLREVCLFAEKVDIAEEITRLKSHFLQFEETLLDKTSEGKKLEFILQEMQREINTIASKSQDTAIARHTIEFKTELERIREQLQNVE